MLGPICLTAQVGELERLATGLMIEIMEFPRTWKPTILVHPRLTLLTKMITMSQVHGLPLAGDQESFQAQGRAVAGLLGRWNIFRTCAVLLTNNLAGCLA